MTERNLILDYLIFRFSRATPVIANLNGTVIFRRKDPIANDPRWYLNAIQRESDMVSFSPCSSVLRLKYHMQVTEAIVK